MAKVSKIDIPMRGSFDASPYIDGQVWELTKGEDFASVNTARVAFHRDAKAAGKQAMTRFKDGILYVKAV